MFNRILLIYKIIDNIKYHTKLFFKKYENNN